MRRWAIMLGGLIVWAIHFFGAYAIASTADVVSAADDPAWRAAGLAFSLACLALAAAILGAALLHLRRAGEDLRDAFVPQLAALGAGLALIAIAWQSAPFIVGY